MLQILAVKKPKMMTKLQKVCYQKYHFFQLFQKKNPYDTESARDFVYFSTGYLNDSAALRKQK